MPSRKFVRSSDRMPILSGSSISCLPPGMLPISSPTSSAENRHSNIFRPDLNQEKGMIMTTNNLSTGTSFQRLRREKGLTSRQVAEAAGVSLREEYLFEIGGIVSKEIEQKIMQAFQQLTGEPPEEQPTVTIQKLSRPLKLI